MASADKTNTNSGSTTSGYSPAVNPVKRRGAERTNLKKLLPNLQALIDGGDKALCEEAFFTLEDRRRRLSALDREVAPDIADDKWEDEMERIAEYEDFITTWQTRLRRVYCATMSVGSNVSISGSASGQNVMVPSVAGSNTSNSSQSGFNVRLPKFDIPKFGGDILKWTGFWEAFKTAVHDCQGLSTIVKFNYLRSLLVDDALRCVSGFSITEANYVIAVDKLKARFGREEQIIDGMTAALLRLAAPRTDVVSLRRFFDEIENKVLGLKSLNVDVKACSSILVPHLVRQLPSELKLQWARSHCSLVNDIESFLDFLRIEVELRERINFADSVVRVESKDSRESKVSVPKPSKVSSSTSALNITTLGNNSRASVSSKGCCFICDGNDHLLKDCPLETARDRKGSLYRLRKCFNCFANGHGVAKCPSKPSVCKTCNGSHNTYLCPVTYVGESNNSQVSNVARVNHSCGETNVKTVESQPSISVSSNNVCGARQTNVVLLMSAVVLVDGSKNQVRARLMLDGGSQASFISERLSRMVGADQVGMETMNIDVFGSTSTGVKTLRKVRVRLFDHGGSNCVSATLTEIDNVCSKYNAMPSEWVCQEMARRGLPMADPGQSAACDLDSVDIIIGNDLYWQIVYSRVEVLGKNIAAVESMFGWLVSGSDNNGLVTSSSNVVNVTAMHVCFNDEENDRRELEEDVQKFWSLEGMGISSEETVSPTNDAVESKVYETMQYIDGRYRVHLPWNERKSELRSNQPEAMRRFFTLVRRFGKEEKKIVQYHQTMMDYVHDGHAEVVPTEELERGSVTYYIPHQAVFRTNHDTMKLRIVFDASSGKPSLNECLHPGPHLNPDVLDLLLRFRQHAVALTADMEKAFLQVEIDPEDRDAARFVWLPDNWKPGDPVVPVVYRMKRVLFGLNCGPFLLAATLLYHLRNAESVDPEVIQQLTGNVYVDDLVKSVMSALMGWRLYHDGKKLMKEAGFNLRKWATNSEELRKTIAEHEEGSGEFSEKTKEEFVKVLGMKWSQWSDNLQFDVDELLDFLASMPPTKRTILRAMARIFDPIGLVGPFTVRMKMLFQNLWKMKLSWDDELSPEMMVVWMQWKEELRKLQELKIPRCISARGEQEADDINVIREYHVFCDASEKVYGAVVYLVERRGSSCVSRLVCSKNKVAPVKSLTIPRLELMGALIAVRIMKTVKTAMGEDDVQVYFWTDSMVALCWIQGDPSRWKTFVANRVREIRQLSDPKSWNHVRTAENPADKITRGLTSDALLIDDRWWTGPVWLTDYDDYDMDDVSEPDPDEEVLSEEKKTNNVCVQQATIVAPLINVDRFSHWSKAVRVTAYVLRFMNNCRNLVKASGGFSAEELRKAETVLLVHEQKQMYPEESDALQRDCCVNKQSKLHRFDPKIGEDGLVRLGGRLHFSTLDLNVKHPVIIDGSSWTARLIIEECHRNVLHGGVAETLIEVRERFWIPSARSKVKAVLRQCVVCLRRRAKATVVAEAPLPTDRIEETAPFEIIGIDYAGPVYVKEGKTGQRKTYVLLLTCAVTRAVHLELVKSMTADDFLMAFRRFVSRRGFCRVIWSDNAKTFKRGHKDLELWAKMVNFAGEHRIEWKFIADRAPWWGGIWERMVRSVKEKMKTTCGRAMLEFEELRTILAEIEGIINSRPLSYVSDEMREVITPAHLVVGRRLTVIPPASKAAEQLTGIPDVGKLWKNRLVLLNRFWKAWRNDYLLTLRSIHERRNPSRKESLEVGQLVLLDDERTVRHLWKTCVITEVLNGRDGLVRSCMIKTSEGKVMKRPVQLLYPLEIMDKDFD